MRNLYFISLIILFSLNSCKEESQKIETASKDNSSIAYSEQFRPQFHFSPPEKWMNDPNGLVYHKGVYHLFYQYYPDDIVWGPMHWGHATSKDLIHWENKPIALFPDEHGLIFSGSAVVDVDNTSGFGSKENPPLVAIFTYHLMAGEKAGRTDFQTQGIAYSLDNGETWTKYSENPVIGNIDIKDFRDPKVFWYEEGNYWVMALVAGDHAKFYKSNNLKSWELTGEFGKDNGAHGGVWECPDLFKIKVEDTDEEKWVLIISINPGAPNGGSGTQYFIGDFDGNTFTAEHEDFRWIDYGSDNYAGVTYNNVPTKDRIFIGWMSNWNYAQTTPTEVWRSAMTLPRQLTLHSNEADYYLKNYPIDQFKGSKAVFNEKSISLKKSKSFSSDTYNASNITFQFNLKDGLKVTFKNSKNEALVFQADPDKNTLSLDRTKSGNTAFEERFAHKIHTQPYTSENRLVEARIIMDTSSIEVFIDGGRYVFTEQFFPSEDLNTMILSSQSEAVINNLNVSLVESIW